MTFTSDVMTSFWRRHSVKFMFDITIRFISASTHDILKIIFFVSNVLRVREYVPPTPICVTFTDDLEIQGQVILHMT